MYNLGNPDIIFIFGGTNDSWAGVPMGKFQYSGWTKADLYSFRPAFCRLLAYIVERYPKAAVYNITNSELSKDITDSMNESYTTNDIIDLSEFYVSKKGIRGSYFTDGVYPTFTWYTNGNSDPLEEGKDYTTTEPGKFKFNRVPENSVYCVIASKAYPAYQDYNSPYRTTDTTIEKAAEPAIILTTSNERVIGFSLGATEDNTSIQIDWGDGNLVDKVINSAKTSIQGTPAGTKNIKIYADAAKIKEVSLAYCDYLTGVDLSKCTALQTLSIKESSKITSIAYPEDITTLENLTIDNSSIKNIDLHNWSGLKNLFENKEDFRSRFQNTMSKDCSKQTSY